MNRQPSPSPAHVILLVHDLHVRIVDAATGELLRELVLDPTKRYQPIPGTHASH